MLSRRLSALVDAGLLERKLYSKHPSRYEYLLTEKGKDFWSVLVSLMAYGNRHFAREGVASRVVDAETDKPLDPILIDRHSGRVLDQENSKLGTGPAASPALRTRVRYSDQRRRQGDGSKEWDEYVRLRRGAPQRTTASRKREGTR